MFTLSKVVGTQINKFLHLVSLGCMHMYMKHFTFLYMFVAKREKLKAKRARLNWVTV